MTVLKCRTVQDALLRAGVVNQVDVKILEYRTALEKVVANSEQAICEMKLIAALNILEPPALDLLYQSIDMERERIATARTKLDRIEGQHGN